MASSDLDNLLSESSDTLKDYLGRNSVPQIELDKSLLKCCRLGNGDGVEILLQHGANVDYGNSLRFAMESNKEEVLLALIRHGARYETMDNDDMSFFLWVCHKGYSNLVRYLVEENRCDLDDCDCTGRYAVHVACYYGQFKVVEYLIRKGYCDVNMPDENGWTPLHYVCFDAEENCRRIIKFLLDCEANTLLKNGEGKTALELAFESGQIHYFVKLLSTKSLIKLLVYVDDIVPPKADGSDIQPRKEQEIVHKLRDERSSSISSNMSDPDDMGFNCPMHKLLTVGLWQKIFQNDDVKLLKILRDSGIWKSGDGEKTFVQAQKLDNECLAKLFRNCYENGLGIHTYVSKRYSTQLKNNDFKSIFKELTGFSSGSAMTSGGHEIISSLHNSIVLVALLCGRLKVVELLLRMRQFDMVPSALVMCIIACRLAQVNTLPHHGIDALNAFSAKVDKIAGDAVSRMYTSDKSPGNQNTLEMIDLPLSTYGNLSWIDLANKTKCTNFLTLQCCQLVLDKRWYGKLASLTPAWRWACMLFPFMYIFYVLRYRKTKTVIDNYNGYIELSDQTGEAVVKSEPTSDCKTVRFRNPVNGITLFGHVFCAPSSKFVLSSVFYFVFLILFSYVTLWDFHFMPTPVEILCILFIVSYAVEEFKQFTIVYWKYGTRIYIKDPKNWLDLSALILSITGLMIRSSRLRHDHFTELGEAHEPILYWARVFLLSGLVLFYIRILFILSLSSNLGPKLKMMGNMLFKDLLPLLLIFSIFFMAFGILYQGLLFPNGFPVGGDRNSVKKTLSLFFRRAIYSMFVSDYILDELTCSDENTCGNLLGQRLILYFYHVIYIITVNIMLISLLIALFSETVSRISECSKLYWLADRYNMIQEYEQRSAIPPPFSIIMTAIEAMLRIWSYCGCEKSGCIIKAFDEIKKKPMEVIIPHLIIQTFALKKHRYQLGEITSSEVTHHDDMVSSIQEIRSKLDELLSSTKFSDRTDSAGIEEIIVPKKASDLNVTKLRKKTFRKNNSSAIDSFIKRLERMSST